MRRDQAKARATEHNPLTYRERYRFVSSPSKPSSSARTIRDDSRSKYDSGRSPTQLIPASRSRVKMRPSLVREDATSPHATLSRPPNLAYHAATSSTEGVIMRRREAGRGAAPAGLVATRHSGGIGAPPGTTRSPCQELADVSRRKSIRPSSESGARCRKRPRNSMRCCCMSACGAPLGTCVPQGTSHRCVAARRNHVWLRRVGKGAFCAVPTVSFRVGNENVAHPTALDPGCAGMTRSG